MLPFTHEQFLDVFAAYNQRVWPFAAALWLLTLGTLIHLSRVGPRASPAVATILMIHWAWSAIGYHLAFFREVNPAATLFAGLFVVEMLLLFWRGILTRNLTFTPSGTAWGLLGGALAGYSLLYPGISLLSGMSYPHVPTFGVPCPTTILTIGLLLMVPPRQGRPLAVVPLIWSAIGGSAAFLLAVPADLALLFAGAGLLLHVLRAEPT